MSEPSGRELLSEWRQVMESVVSSATAAAGRSELAGDLLRASQRQLELLQEVVAAEERLRGSLLGGVLAPVEAVFDLLQESGATLRKQAETMESAGRALQETSALMKQQAELFERMIAVLRQPTDIARAAVKGGQKRPKEGAKPHKKA